MELVYTDEGSGRLQGNAPGSMGRLRGHSIAYRVAVGRYQGRKAFTVQTVPASPSRSDPPASEGQRLFASHRGVGQ